MPVLHSHIIPSLALQACQTRDTVKSRFSNPPLIVDKGALGPFDRLRDRGSFGTVGELAELAVISCTRVKDTAWILKTKNGTPHTRS